MLAVEEEEEEDVGGFEEIVLSEDVFTSNWLDGIVLSAVVAVVLDVDGDDDDEEGRFKKTSNE